MIDPPIAEFGDEAKEVHGLIHGVYNGFYRVREPADIPKHDDIRADPHYYKFGYMIGDVIDTLVRNS